MGDKTEIESARFCMLMCWIAGIVGGLIVAVIVVKAWDMHPLAGVVLGSLATMALAFLFYWLFCDEDRDAAARKANAWVEPGDLPEAAELDEADVAGTAPEVAEDEDDDVDAAPEPDLVAPVAGSSENPAAESEAAPEVESIIQPSKSLPGEADLSGRKGEWRYGDAQGAPGADVDYDGDGVVEGSNEGSRPAALDAAQDGKPDNLKEIKGVGPKMETMLNELGFYHFDQIAGWTDDEVAWVDANLKGFKGRVSRDNWVDQAKTLASGGETEFSKRVEDGEVY